MAQGSGSARLCLLIGVGMLCLLTITKPTFAANWTVGDTGGWTFHADKWPEGKSFHAGDILLFNYDKTAHNVVVVDKNGYDSCTALEGSKVYQTGKDSITLQAGDSHFICTFPAHCAAAMKIAITAT